MEDLLTILICITRNNENITWSIFYIAYNDKGNFDWTLI